RCLKLLTDLYIANSQRGASDIQSIAGIKRQKMHVIHNGVAVRAGGVSARERVAAVAIIANITPYKGHIEFIRALASVGERRREFKVWLVGRNEMGAVLHEEIARSGLSDIVEYMGFLTDPSEVMSRARVVALPSPII